MANLQNAITRYHDTRVAGCGTLCIKRNRDDDEAIELISSDWINFNKWLQIVHSKSISDFGNTFTKKCAGKVLYTWAQSRRTFNLNVLFVSRAAASIQIELKDLFPNAADAPNSCVNFTIQNSNFSSVNKIGKIIPNDENVNFHIFIPF